MDWILQYWQTIATFAIVAITLAIFAWNLAKPKKKAGCGGGCGCAAKETKSKIQAPGTKP